MVSGATGIIRSAVVQIVKYFGTTVAATARTKNLELAQSLGADLVIDYTNEDFTEEKETYDFILGEVDKSIFAKYRL